jgi:long-subunit fatty acid transport protein
VHTTDGAQPLASYINNISNSIYQAGVEAAMAGKTEAVLAVTKAGEELSQQSGQLAKYYNGVYLQSDQNGFGVCPIIGLDVKYQWVNFAFKYEFRTKMNMTNSSTVKEAGLFSAVNQFVDGTSVREDTPALLTLGLELEPLKGLRFDVGYHHFYDRQARKTYFDANGNRHDDKNQMLSHGTNEWLVGAEYDFGKDKRWTVSGGIQTTNYGNTDEYMSDISFVTNSWSFGTGVKYKINDKMAVNVGYFQTNYRDYNQAADYRDAAGSNNQFTRRNRVFAAGLDIDF